MAKKSTPAPSPKPMTVPAAARIHDGKVQSGSFAARAQRAAAHNTGGNK